MPPSQHTTELLTFFKALADLNRLRIVGLLATESHTVEQLAAGLGLTEGTVSHHLRRLSQAELVEARPDGYYRWYSLRADALERMAQRLLRGEAVAELAEDREIDFDARDRKVLATFTDGEGRITAFPSQQKKFLVLLRYVLEAFEPGRRYSEPEVNAILKRFNDDTARVRRAFVEHRMMEREGGGGAYWRTADPSGDDTLREPPPER